MPRMAIACAGLLVAVASAAADEDPWFSENVAAPVTDDRPLRRTTAEQPDRQVASAAERTAMPDWLRTGLALGGVTALIVILGYASRRVPGLYRGRRPGMIQIVSRTQISGKQSLCLVRVGPRMILVGVAGDRLSRLDVIDDASLTAQLAGEAQQSEPDSSTKEFKSRLHRESDRYLESDDEDAGVADERMNDVKERLIGTLERLRARRSA